MRLEQLNYLIAIDRYHSMNKAAESIFISQQSISKAIMQLEEEFQTQLVLRTNKGSFLTEAGHELSRAAQDFYHRCDAVKECFAQKPISAKLHLLLEYSLLAIWDALFLYYAMYAPHIELERTHIDYVDLEDAIEKNPDSIAVSYLHDEFLHIFLKKYHCQLVKTSFLSLHVAKDSPLAQNKTISLKNLHNMKIPIYTLKNKPSVLMYLLKKYHLEANNNQYIYQITPTLQKELSKRHDVVYFAPHSSILESTIAVTLKEKIPMSLYCISKNAEIPTELVYALISF